jgi:hypothetical protein
MIQLGYMIWLDKEKEYQEWLQELEKNKKEKNKKENKEKTDDDK